MVANSSFWKGKRVLLTGHTGFKGSWMSLWLQSMGADTLGYSLDPPTDPSLFEIASVAKGMKSLNGDVCDLKSLQSAINDHNPEIIIHMAAQSLVRYSYDHPVETYATNVLGTVNVLESARHAESVRVVLVVTSDKCYRNNEWHWGYRENEPMGGHDPYSSSKGCAELVVDAFRNSYFPAETFESHGVAVASVRAGNVIGGGDWSSDRLIADIIDAFIADRPVMIRNPHAIRPWQHVLDPLNGYLCLCEHLWEKGQELSGGWNFGPNDDDARPVSWIVEQLVRHWGKGASWELDGGNHPHEAQYLKLDCSKAKSLLGWRPRMNITTSLESIVAWYGAYMEKKDMREVTLAEIDTFTQI